MNFETNKNVMEYIDTYSIETNPEIVSTEVEKIVAISRSYYNVENLKLILSCLDYTSLNNADNSSSIYSFVNKVNQFSNNYPSFGNVAAICVFPNFTENVKKRLQVENVKIAAVSAGFPSSQTFIEIKIAETSLAVMYGADEIDVVISLGNIKDEKFADIIEEVSEIKAACRGTKLKVILETGLLSNNEIKIASILAIEGGADFIKTSTGKILPAATPEAFYIMANAVKAYYKNTGVKVGLKAAGGISETSSALIYYTIVKEVLGDEWLNNNYFRVGASKLADNILEKLCKLTNKEFKSFF